MIKNEKLTNEIFEQNQSMRRVQMESEIMGEKLRRFHEAFNEIGNTEKIKQ